MAIYLHRCLSDHQILSFFYQEDDSNNKIENLIVNKLVELVEYQPSNNVYFLTTLGVNCVNTIYNKELQELYGSNQKSFPMASDLKIKAQNINHQIHLNEFVLQFLKFAQDKINFRYYDEKFMPKASDFMMPDGVIELEDKFILLEMDMGTETTQRLSQKWESYRLFLNFPGAFYMSKPIVMFFILEGVKNVELRRRNIMSNILEYLSDRINGKFEIYIDSPENLQDIIKTQLSVKNSSRKFGTNNEKEICVSIKNDYGFLISFQPTILFKVNAPFTYYIRKLINNKIAMEDGRAQEFLMDIWIDGRLSICRNMLYFKRISKEIKQYTGRLIPYIIVVKSEMWIAQVLQSMKIGELGNIYFTTLDRLKAIQNRKGRYEWPEALFQIDRLGNLVHFKDMSLQETVHERKILK